ncbi:MAG: DNA repair protein RadA [Ruminococcaceae bacterium]|nr:DNA repair protein RadA [Oscillospiraceae bacterium]
MKGSKIIFVCSECGYTSPKWLGRCPECQAWNTFEEIEVKEKNSKTASGVKMASKNKAEKLSELKIPDYIRTATGMGELDRVLGGGLVDSSVVLLSGEPGIGKSTLLLQICRVLSQTRKVLYVSGEESQGQLKLRAERLLISGDNIFLLTETDLDAVIAECERLKPDVIIIDSVQTMYSEGIPSAPGSITQVREGTLTMVNYAKASGAAVFLVGHVNKEGGISGPKLLEHMVDAVLYFEGERTNSYRIIRAIKNRFGSTNEIGVFEMGEKGLAEIPNPSEVVMAERPKNTSGSCAGCVMQGTRPIITEIQSLVTKTVFATGKRAADGFDINRLGLLIAVLEKRMGLKFYENDVYLNVAGGLTLDEPSADLSIAMSLISGITDRVIPDELIAFGEIGLSGEVRAVSHIDYRVKEAVRLGFKEIVLPEKNINQSLSVPSDVKLIGVTNIYQALACMRLKKVSE